jgi:hypothetical protein
MTLAPTNAMPQASAQRRTQTHKLGCAAAPPAAHSYRHETIGIRTAEQGLRFRYLVLGVASTLTLGWKHQCGISIQQQGEGLMSESATYGQHGGTQRREQALLPLLPGTAQPGQLTMLDAMRAGA